MLRALEALHFREISPAHDSLFEGVIADGIERKRHRNVDARPAPSAVDGMILAAHPKRLW